MGFVVQWFWYLVAYLFGSLVAWLVAVITIRRTSADEAFADLSDSRTPGAQ